MSANQLSNNTQLPLLNEMLKQFVDLIENTCLTTYNCTLALFVICHVGWCSIELCFIPTVKHSVYFKFLAMVRGHITP